MHNYLTSLLIDRTPEDGTAHQPGLNGQHFVGRAYSSDWYYPSLEEEVRKTITKHRTFFMEKLNPKLVTYNARKSNSPPKDIETRADIKEFLAGRMTLKDVKERRLARKKIEGADVDKHTNARAVYEINRRVKNEEST